MSNTLKLFKRCLLNRLNQNRILNLRLIVMKKIVVIFLFFLIEKNTAFSQGCTTLGQTPSTAFPVCGTKKFVQSNVPICSTVSLYVPGCTGNSNANYANKNPYFYKFTCYTAGTLGFLVTPNNAGDDYDWQLYDITGHNPDDIFTDKTLVVTGNWAGTYGNTGASASGVAFIQCASDPAQNLNSFAQMPVLTQGHEYLLMISHFTDSQSGYTLEFNGGTASITDPVIPSLKSAKPNCDSKEIVVKLGKKIRCNTIAGDGSDFSLSPAIANVVKVVGYGCSTGFDSDSLLVTLDNTIPAGNYSLVAKNGSDGNTLLDFCDNAIPVGQQVNFTVAALVPTHIDSLAPVGCAPDKLVLVFQKNIQCSSIAPDGSDFIINGTAAVNIAAAKGDCNTNGTTSTITLTLTQPISVAGNFTITLKNGIDGNPIVDECGIVTPVGESISFTTADTVSAAFTYTLDLGCKFNTVNLFHDGKNGVKQWLWTFEDLGGSTMQNPQVIYPNINGTKTIGLIVSNGVCSDTSSQVITTNNQLTAIFTGPDILCPEDLAVFTDTSTGDVSSWYWDFDNGATATTKIAPPQAYPPTNSPKVYTIQLVVSNGICADTAYKNMTVVKSCYIAVPNVFTPNGDNLNDYLYPLNAYKADNLEFKVYNRFGQLVFQTTNWLVKWDGTINGNPQPTGTYVWYLKYTNHDTGQKIFLKGTTVLIR